MINQAIVIFGGSGDLTKRKLMPALYNLFNKGVINANSKIIATGRTKMSTQDYRLFFGDMDDQFLTIVEYLVLDPHNERDYIILKSRLESTGCSNYLYYLATPPSLYNVIPQNLKKVELNIEPNEIKECAAQRRIVIEKPFGYDLKSAEQMNRDLKTVFSEDQIYRIDHYLGKETVQNILALRFANSIFEPIWNRHHIDRVEITAVENMGIEDRGGFYDGVGALRDMVQNHLVQLMALVAMEPPVKFAQKEFRDEVVKVYNSLKPLSAQEIDSRVIRGQYIESMINRSKVLGYRDEKGVKKDSETETFVAIKLNISNWRWEGVPFYIRTGKRMPTKVTEIVIHFKKSPHKLFSSLASVPEQNVLIIRIQPNEGIVLKFDAKVPGKGFNVSQVPMEFTYDKLAQNGIEDAYSKLIQDAIVADSTLFTRSDAVEASWNFFDPIIAHWNSGKAPLYGYPAGSWGPLSADSIIEGDISFTNPCKNLTNTNIYCEL